VRNTAERATDSAVLFAEGTRLGLAKCLRASPVVLGCVVGPGTREDGRGGRCGRGRGGWDGSVSVASSALAESAGL
jgi:hypothetical protein